MSILFAIAAAFAGPSDPVGEPPLPKRIGPPMRVDHRVMVRPNTQATVITELGMQLIRGRRVALDLNVGGAPAAGLRLPGQQLWRNLTTISAGLDLLWEPAPLLSVGPSLNLDLRIFRQQFTDVGTTFTPNLGLRANVHLLRGRWWSVCLTLKPAVDLVPTELVLATSAIQRLAPFSAQAGVRIEFGHGRVWGAR